MKTPWWVKVEQCDTKRGWVLNISIPWYGWPGLLWHAWKARAR